MKPADAPALREEENMIAENRAAADRAVFMDEGLIVEEGKPDVLFSNPSHERTQLFLSKIL